MNVWDSIFKSKGKFFVRPHSDMGRLVRLFKKRGVVKILDAGCGTGRHAVHLAEKGFRVFGFDASPAGIQITKAWLARRRLQANVRLLNFNQKFPYPAGFFDAVVSVQTLHHNIPKKIHGVVREVERVLHAGGILFVTVPKRRQQASRFKKIGERTYIPLDGNEKGLVHYYFNKKSIRYFFGHFTIQDIHIDRWNHYCFVGIKKPPGAGAS